MRARAAAILAAGGAERSNVFTRATLALFGQVPWRAVPVMPPEIILLPRWFPFHLSKVSYWARTVLVPLTVVMARRPPPLAPIGVDVAELFRTPPDAVRHWPQGRACGAALEGHVRRGWTACCSAPGPLPRPPPAARRGRAERFVTERLNGEDGLGGIYPAMANAMLMYHCLGVPAVRPAPGHRLGGGREAGPTTATTGDLRPALPVAHLGHRAGSHALLEAGGAGAEAAARRGLDWLLQRQITDLAGDWARRGPACRPAAGPSSTPTRTTRTWTTPRWWCSRWTAPAGSAGRRR